MDKDVFVKKRVADSVMNELWLDVQEAIERTGTQVKFIRDDIYEEYDDDITGDAGDLEKHVKILEDKVAALRKFATDFHKFLEEEAEKCEKTQSDD